MRENDLKKALETFDRNGDGDTHRVTAYMRSGVTITGTAHPYKDGSAVWIDVEAGGDGVLPTSVSVEAIEAIQWAG